MKIGNRSIGPNEPPLIIAEIGINHGGSLDVAKSMVDLIVHSGCECVKHQTHIIEDEMTEEAKAIFPPNANKSIWDVMKECSLKLDEEQELKEYAENLGLIWISTPFSRMAADFLDEIDVPAFKIGSGEADNLPLINHIAQKGKPIIMSTGMQSIKSLKNSVNILEKSGVEYALLECTNLYPSPPEIVSLQGIQELKEAFPKALVGFSDHSIGPHIALASVALGACIIERHFTDTRYRSGPDITCSMDPAELRLLVDRSIEIHKATDESKTAYRTRGKCVYKFARASVVADRDMAAGHIITEKDIWVRRPGSGEIPGYKYNDIIGKKLRLDVKKNHQFKWSNFH